MKNTAGFPFWVTVGLYGIGTRRAALIWMWLSIALAAGCVLYGFWNSRFFIGIGWLLAALWYWLCIRWVDKNASWE